MRAGPETETLRVRKEDQRKTRLGYMADTKDENRRLLKHRRWARAFRSRCHERRRRAGCRRLQNSLHFVAQVS